MAYIDIDPTNLEEMSQVWEMLVGGLVRIGGAIVIDNVAPTEAAWPPYLGSAVPPELTETLVASSWKNVDGFNRAVAADRRVVGALLPVRDGMWVVVRVS
mmetsp:Transcript_94709/g.216647  ORF Transcript_94709/g.216647 Transcript_94709/m.216647 type:complete len:100 (+) Transcript_94709:444-743(+)